MSESPEIFSTPKLINGEGDGIKNITVRRRVPISSARKFNPNVPPDDTMRIRIGNALSELRGRPKIHTCLKKSQTVAEITPTKSKVKKRPVMKSGTDGDAAAGTTLHATPRRVDEETPAASAPGRCPRERAACVVYQRLLLCVWRRSKERLATLTESCGRQKDQISQLEMQVDVLKNLRNSESQKRSEALNECQQLRKTIDILDTENHKLSNKLRSTEEELQKNEESLKLTRSELKKSAEQIAKIQEQLKKKKQERLELLTKVSTQEFEILKQNSNVCQLEDQLETMKRNLQNTEANYKAKQEECSDVIEKLQKEIDLNYSLNEQILSLQDNKTKLEDLTRDLENQLQEYSISCDELLDENMSMRCNLQETTIALNEAKRKTWVKNAKEIAILSLTALHKVAHVMLPAYLDYPVK